MGSSFESMWHGHELEGPAETAAVDDQRPPMCLYAQKFGAWAEELCKNTAQDVSIVKINQGKVLLLDKYMEWRQFVPKRHRNYTATSANGHTCLFHIFEHAYDLLRLLELSLTPPMLFLPQPAPAPLPPPPPPQIAGIFIGELDE